MTVMATTTAVASSALSTPTYNCILYVKSLPFQLDAEELYELFGKYGNIRQIRIGSTPDTRGKAYVVYENSNDAKRALLQLNGFNFQGRYLVCLLYNGKKRTQTALTTDSTNSVNDLRQQILTNRENERKKRVIFE